MNVPKKEYIGFTFNGIHSSKLGIVRTSDGSRFNQNLLPSSQDKLVPIPGSDGVYYFGSQYSQRQFPVSFAFDSLTEEKIRALQQLLGDKKIHDLNFDELPYKIYQAKITGSNVLKYIPFEERKSKRIYKGEGNIQFSAFYPYAFAPFKFLDQYDINGQEEWLEASGMKKTQGQYDILDQTSIPLYNPGDIESNWILTMNFDEEGLIQKTKIFLDDNNFLSLNEINPQGDDTVVKINSKIGLIEGYKVMPSGALVKTGNIYNGFIKDGDFFKIPKSFNNVLKQVPEKELYMQFDNSNGFVDKNLKREPLDYTYYYF